MEDDFRKMLRSEIVFNFNFLTINFGRNIDQVTILYKHTLLYYSQ